MVALDNRSCSVGATRLDEVRIQRPLDEELRFGDAPGVLFENPDEPLADGFALRFGLGQPSQRLEERRAFVSMNQLDAEVTTEGLHNLSAFVLAHQTSVDVHAGQLRTNRLMHERCRHRRVDSTGQTTDHTSVADAFADQRHLLLDHRRHLPLGRNTGALMEETLHRCEAIRRVLHLGVKLDAVDPALVVFQHCHRRTGRRRRHGEAVRSFSDAVEMAHPAFVTGGRVVGKNERVAETLQLGSAVLAAHPATDGASELLCD